MPLTLDVINAFTQRDFGGNPAAVVLLPEYLEATVMQNIASQNNLSETAFVVEQSGRYHIRWFSPKTEIDFCGHATLASAFVLFEQQPLVKTLHFYALSIGNFEVTRGPSDRIQMVFPQRHIEAVETIPPALLAGLTPVPEEVYVDQQAYYVVYPSEDIITDVTYETSQLEMLAPLDVCVTAQSTHYDFVSRYFWPANGGDEDPTTGSAHTSLGPFWANRLSKTELHAYQASVRGGDVFCQLHGDKINICGFAKRYLSGTVFIDS